MQLKDATSWWETIRFAMMSPILDRIFSLWEIFVSRTRRGNGLPPLERRRRRGHRRRASRWSASSLAPAAGSILASLLVKAAIVEGGSAKVKLRRGGRMLHVSPRIASLAILSARRRKPWRSRVIEASNSTPQ